MQFKFWGWSLWLSLPFDDTAYSVAFGGNPVVGTRFWQSGGEDLWVCYEQRKKAVMLRLK